MPKITIPQKQDFSLSYRGDKAAEIVESFNLDFHKFPGKIGISPKMYPHTTNADIGVVLSAPSSYLYSNFDNGSGTYKYVAIADRIYLTTGATTLFSPDTLVNSPSPFSTSDEEAIVHGRSNSGSDILVVTNGTNIERFDRDFSTTNWQTDWWTGSVVNLASADVATPISMTSLTPHGFSTGDMILVQTTVATSISILSSTNATPIVITTTTQHGFQNGDQIIVSGHTVNTNANGTWTITVVDATRFSIPVSGNGVGGNTGSATEVSTGLNNQWTITKTGANTFTLQESAALGIRPGAHGYSTGGSATRLYDITNNLTSLGQPALVSGVPHILKVFGNAPLLFILDGRFLHSINSPGSISSPASINDVKNRRLVFKNGYVGNWITVTAFKVYIGLKDVRGESYPSLVEEYDPFSETVREFVINEGATMGYLYGNTPILIDKKGKLKNFNGTDWTVISPDSNFPTAYIDSLTIITLPHRNGFAVLDGRMTFLIGSTDTRYYSGLWVFEEDTKRLYHECSPTISKTSLNSFGTTFANGTFRALFCYDGVNQYFASCDIPTTLSSGATRGIFTNTTGVSGVSVAGNTRGHFTTGKIQSSEIDEVWRNVLVKYDPRQYRSGTSTGTIVVKYRTFNPSNPSNAEYSGTWTSANTFTTVIATASLEALGDEIFITRGPGAGATFHISFKDVPSGSTVKITTDESMPVTPSGDFGYTLENWLKVDSNITDNTKESALIFIPSDNPNETAPGVSEWIQLKVEVRDSFFVEQMQIGLQPNLKVEN